MSTPDWPLLVAGVLFVLWPLQYRRGIARVRDRLVDRGADPRDFDRRTSARRVRVALVVAPIAGAVLIVASLL